MQTFVKRSTFTADANNNSINIIIIIFSDIGF